MHGYIVEQFADGVDECQPIGLGADDLSAIIEAIKEDRLPRTTGFFFGESENDEEQKDEAIAILLRALQWLQTDDGKTWRSIIYQASW